MKGDSNNCMTVRPFEWRDIPTLHRYRAECVFLDTALALTRGPIFVPTGALLSALANATGLYTFIHQDDQALPSMVAQVLHTAGLASAQLTFLAPQSGLKERGVSGLVEYLVAVLGERGALHILAEVEEQSAALDILRQAGFGVYARQHIWHLPTGVDRRSVPNGWRSSNRQDEAAIRFLYANLVPGMVQQVEALPAGRLRGLVYYRGTELLAYVDLVYGLHGILAQPFIHPDADTLPETLLELLQSMPDLYSRPVYVRVRSYQFWLEPMLGKKGAQQTGRQAVMVRHLAVTRRVNQSLTVPAINGSTTEPTVPIARIKTK